MDASTVFELTPPAAVLATWVASVVARHRIARDRRTDQQRRRAADVFARSVTALAAEWGAEWVHDLNVAATKQAGHWDSVDDWAARTSLQPTNYREAS